VPVQLVVVVSMINPSDTGRLHFLTTYAEPKLQSKYLLKSKSEVILLSENMATHTDSLVN